MKLYELLEYNDIVIQCHDNPDADALSSGYALYWYLQNMGTFRNQTEAGKKSGQSRSNISAALNGKESILTDSFLRKFNKAFGSLFSDEWLIDGIGEMLRVPDGGTAIVNNQVGKNNQVGNGNHFNSDMTLNQFMVELAAQRKLTEKAQEQMDRLITIIEKFKE